MRDTCSSSQISHRCIETQSTYLLVNWINCSLTWHIGGGMRLLPSWSSRVNLVRSGLRLKRLWNNQFPKKGQTKFLLQPSLSGTLFGTKIRHKKRRCSFCQFSINQWQWMSGMDGSQRKTNLCCPHCGSQYVESMEHKFFSSALAQQVWHYVANIMWQLFVKKVTFVLGNISQWCSASWLASWLASS
jgi:hypothetical protein